MDAFPIILYGVVVVGIALIAELMIGKRMKAIGRGFSVAVLAEGSLVILNFFVEVPRVILYAGIALIIGLMFVGLWVVIRQDIAHSPG